MMKKIYLILTILLSFLAFSQGGYGNITNHQRGNLSIEPSVRIGENNKGLNLLFGYYLNDFLVVRAGATYRKFDYKSYNEDILEGNMEIVYTVYSPRYDDPFLHKFNFATALGLAYENVKVTSNTSLIDPYPKYIYAYAGAQLEFTISDHIGLIGNFRQYYAVNGSKEKIGNWRYDYGVGFRYYLWGKY